MTGLPLPFRDALAGRYRVEREIGQGGMATVYLATDLKHQRPVAVKVLLPELAHSLGAERFLREIEIAAKLQHPNILPVYDSGEADGMLYYVMPFVEGESLADRIARQGSLSPAEAIRIAREVADALDYAHRQGIVHRDIKPANVLLSQGHAMIADFGIARAVSASAGKGLTQVGMAVGSPTYMSPEQALGEQNLDGRTDIFALGVMLFEMLEGKAPYEGSTPQAIVGQILAGKRRTLAADPLHLQPVIDVALAREPADRFATGADFGAALDRAATGVSPPATRTRRGLVATGVLALAALVLAFVFLRNAGANEDPRRSLIIFPFENRTGDPSRDYLEEGAMNLLGLAASHWQDLRVFDDERTASLLRRHDIDDPAKLDFEVAQDIARDANVGTLVLGDIRLEGDSLAIEAKVHDVGSGDRIATHIVRTTRTADPRPIFDQLAARMLGTSGAPAGERPSLVAQTTSSLEAYRAYLTGTAALQRFEVDTAAVYLQRAVTLDSNFALAYLRLRDAAGWGSVVMRGDRAMQRRWVQAAERRSATLPPRIRSLVEFHGAYLDGAFPRARRIAEGLIARDSTDVEAWYQLGEAHFHHNSVWYPHPDTLGNMGRALRAFQRSLALDSTYMLAYQHILDALRACVTSVAFVCLADSAAYGQPDSLRKRFGDARLAALRTEARDAEIATARGWVSAAPTNVRARSTLVQVLHAQRQYDAVLRELDALVRIGGEAQAGYFRARAEFVRGRPSDAARTLDSALATIRDTAALTGAASSIQATGMLLAGGGRLDASVRLYKTLFRSEPAGRDSIVGPANVLWSMGDLRQMADGFMRAEVGLGADGAAGRALLDLVNRRMARDTIGRRTLIRAFSSQVLSFYLADRDTSALAVLVADTGMATSPTWRVANALLALERKDTARARAVVNDHFPRDPNAVPQSEIGVVRAFAWADLMARLGDHRQAIATYAKLDTVEYRLDHPGLLVRSWAARAASHQALGEREQAVQWYERFATAWQDADPVLQPLVRRAREAAEMLRSGVKAEQPRR